MIKEILFLLLGILCAILFVFIKNKVVNKTKEIVGEKFNLPKFLSGLTNVTSSTSWAKTISTLFNARILIIIGVLVGVIYGYGYFKGISGKPVHFNLQGKEATIKLNEHFLKIEKNGTANVIDKDGKVLKQIKVKDIPELRRALRPYCFQLKPFFTAGGSLGEKKSGGDFGVGIDFLKWYRSNANVFITNQGGYVGVGYQITQNFDILFGVGKGYSGDNRAGLFGKWKF